MFDNIFPNLGSWNDKIENLLKNKNYPPIQSSFIPDEKEVIRDINLNFTNQRIWNLICEEALDTELTYIHYKKVYNEVIQRGLTDHDYQKARKFMWLTVGWLNFEKMLWDWVDLDESDIILAIDLQFKENLIDRIKMEEMKEYVNYISSFDR